MRVLMSPTRSGAGGNPYVENLSAGVSAAGVEVHDYRRRSLLGGFDVLHVNWPAFLIRWDSRAHALADIAKTLAYLAIARSRGMRIVWTAHDLGAHDRPFPRLQRAYERVFARLVTDVVSLSEAGIPLLRERFPELARTRFHVVPHGHYRDDYPRIGLSQQQARAELGLDGDETILLSFGMLRRYKAVERMIGHFGELSRPATRLLVVGESRDPAYTREIEVEAARTPGVTLRTERVDERTVALLMTACDVVYAAYPPGTSLNSGVAVLALSFDRPVVVRDTPVMAELGRLAGPGWVHLAPDGADAAALGCAIEAANRHADKSVDLSALEWSRIAEAMVAVYGGAGAG